MWSKRDNKRNIKLNDEVKSSRKEYITILGIFASIILAFVAGLTFTNSVLSNINNGSIYRLLFITSLIGFFTTNMLHHLYKFIKNINRSDNKQENFDWTIIIFNTIVVVIMLCIFLTWLCNRVLNIWNFNFISFRISVKQALYACNFILPGGKPPNPLTPKKRKILFLPL